MSDLIELERLIKADSAERGQAVSKLGYFCAPFRPVRGPLANKVIKVYRGLRNVAELERLAQCHSDYVAALELTGVDLPATEFHLLDSHIPALCDLIVSQFESLWGAR